MAQALKLAIINVYLAPLIVSEDPLKYRKNLGVLFQKDFLGMGGGNVFMPNERYMILLFGISKVNI